MNKPTYLIIGLGNPGEKYAHTRHNAGFEVTELLEKKFSVKLRKKMLQPWAEAEWTDGEKKIVLCRPLTFMNSSGIADLSFFLKKVDHLLGVEHQTHSILGSCNVALQGLSRCLEEDFTILGVINIGSAEWDTIYLSRVLVTIKERE